jgi:hypothetical protein
MSLVISWRNPLPPARAKRKVRRVIKDRFGSMYLVTQPEGTEEAFGLYLGGRTTVDDLCQGGMEDRQQRAMCAPLVKALEE